MTDLLNRPATRASPKPVALSALVGAGACLLTGLLACAVVAVVGWLAATAGGAATAMRAGAVTWLLAHKAAASVGDSTIGLAPLGLTFLIAAGLYRAGRFTARVSAADRTGELVAATLVLAISYGAGAAVVALIASDGFVHVSSVSALLGGGTLALLAGCAGVLVESGAAEDLADATPDWLREAVPAALAAAGVILAAGGLLFTGALLAHFSRSTAMIEALDPGPVGALVLFAICLVLVPNAILYAVAFVAGPGFQLGTGTTVAPTGVELGNLPALPLLAAVPADGATPGYLLVLTAVLPVLAGVLAGLVVTKQVAAGPVASTTEGLVLRAGLAAVLAATMLLFLMLLAGGSAGPGRMADVGVPSALVAAAVLAVGAALGAIPSSLIAGRGVDSPGDDPRTPALRRVDSPGDDPRTPALRR